jgi:shikimate kinase
MGLVRNPGNVTQCRVRLHAAGEPVNKPFTNVYLIGPMGSGKTTIGQRLAIMLNLEFLDNDRELEEHTGASVNLIFDLEGEEGFRKRETAMLENLTARKNVLVATGGGSILSRKNHELLGNSGFVVYLRTSVGQQIRRLSRDKTRPLLQSGDREEKLTRLAKERNPLYEELADITFPSQNRGLEAATRALYKTILSHWNHQGDSTTAEPGKTGP